MSSTWLGSSLVSVLYEIETVFYFNLFSFFFGRNDFHGRHSPRQVDPGDTGIYANVPSTFPRRTWCDRTNPWAEALSRNSSGQVQSVPKLGRFSRYPSLWACSAWYLLLGTLGMPPPTHPPLDTFSVAGCTSSKMAMFYDVEQRCNNIDYKCT